MKHSKLNFGGFNPNKEEIFIKHPKIFQWDIEVTKNCNLDCDYCYLGKGKSSDNMSMSVARETVKFIKNDLLENKQKRIAITFWGGEPLLNFNIVKFFVVSLDRFTKQKNIEIDFHIITNGTILNAEIQNFIKRYNIHLQISLDGSKDVHDSCRHTKSGKGSFDTIMNNLNQLINDKNIEDINIHSTFTRNSFPLEGTINFFENIQVSHYSISPVVCEAKWKRNLLSSEEIEKEVKVIVDNYFDNLIKSNALKVKNFISFELASIIRKQIKNYICGAGRTMFCIDTCGDIYFCHRFVQESKYKAGSIVKGIDYNKFDELHIKPVNERSNCKKCGFVYLCGGSCIHESLSNYGTESKENNYCAYLKSLYKYLILNLFKLRKADPIKYQKIINQINIAMNIQENKSPFEGMGEITLKNNSQNRVFALSPKAVSCSLEDEGILWVDGKCDKKYIANLTTMAIWDLIDGSRTAQEIAQEIANACEVKFEDIEEDIYKQLTSLEELELIDEVKETAEKIV
jgi:uncharacterized protein